MTDTVRTVTDLNTNYFQDGRAPGSITPQDVRDGWLSAFSVYTTVQTSSYTAVLADMGTVVKMNLSGAGNFTIPPHASVTFPVGAQIGVRQWGAGPITIVAGSGVTLLSPGSDATRAQYSLLLITQDSSNTWIVEGDSA